MTTIQGDIAVGSGVPPSALVNGAASYVHVRPYELVTTSSGVTMLPFPSPTLVDADGTFSISVPALPSGFAYEIWFEVASGRFKSPSRFVKVPSSGTVQFGDLQDVQPPEHAGWGAPSWVAQILTIIASGGTGGGGGGTPTWGSIIGTLANQTDLQSALNAKANLASPTFTGDPKVPTAATSDSDTTAASTAFVRAAIAAYAIQAWGSITGTLTDQTDLAAALALLAPKASPALTGTPTVPTAAAGTNTTQAASTAFVQAAVAALVSSAPTALDTLNELAAALGNDPNFATTITTALGLKAPLASPTFTGDPKAPTPATADNDTSIATTAFVRAAIAAYGAPGGGGAWGSIGGTITDQTDLVAALAALVSLTGPQTIAGVKTFSDKPVVPDASFTSAKLSGLLGIDKLPAGAVVAAAGADTARPTSRTDLVCIWSADTEPANKLVGDLWFNEAGA